jgi:hypothetical protein
MAAEHDASVGLPCLTCKQSRTCLQVKEPILDAVRYELNLGGELGDEDESSTSRTAAGGSARVTFRLGCKILVQSLE